jgi:hypothetical protein
MSSASYPIYQSNGNDCLQQANAALVRNRTMQMGDYVAWAASSVTLLALNQLQGLEALECSTAFAVRTGDKQRSPVPQRGVPLSLKPATGGTAKGCSDKTD